MNSVQFEMAGELFSEMNDHQAAVTAYGLALQKYRTEQGIELILMENVMRYLSLCAGLSCCILFAFFNVSSAFADNSSVEVTVSGSGTSQGAALTEAYVEAVRQTLSRVVDKDTAIEPGL